MKARCVRCTGLALSGRGPCLHGLGAVTLTLAILAGCAGTEQSESGRELVKGGDYDQAVVRFREAVAADPDNQGYKISLAEAESLAADRHVEKARQLLADNRAYAARSELLTALEMMPAHPQALLMMKSAERRISQCEETLRPARLAIASRNSAQALRLIDEAARLDASHPELEEVRQAARALGQTGQAPAAIASTAGAAQPGPAPAPVTPTISASPSRPPQTVAARPKAPRTVTVQPSRPPYKAQPSRPPLTQPQPQPKAPVIPAHPPVPSVQPRSGSPLAEYQRHADAQEWELAWPAAVEALALDPAASNRARQACSHAEREIRQRLAYNLSVLPCKSGTVSIDDALGVCRTLVDLLGQVKPEHVQLLERTNLRQILAEHDLTLSEITDPAKLGALGRKLPGTDLFLFVNVDAYSFSDRQTAGRETTDYVAGRKWEPNPDYAKAEAEFKEARLALDRIRARMLIDEIISDAAARRGQNTDMVFLRDARNGVHGLQAQRAAEAYDAAQQKLNATPQRLEVDDRREHEFPVYRTQRRVDVKVGLRLVEVGTGRILWSDNDCLGQAADTDTSVDPDPARGVSGKPAVTRSADELRAEALANLRPALQTRAIGLLGHRADRYREQGLRSRGDAAVADQVRALFDSPAGTDRAKLDASLAAVFGPRTSGSDLYACGRAAIDRLGLDRPVPLMIATGPRVAPPATGSNPSLTPPDLRPPSTPAPGTAAPPQGAGDHGWVFFPRPERSANDRRPVRTPSASRVPTYPSRRPTPTRSRATARAPGVPPAGISRPEPAPPEPIFRGTVSRDDHRYEKEINTVDGILVKVGDTDPDPLNADIELRVHKHRTKYRKQRTGARLHVIGASGRHYEVVIVRIDDDEETVHFAIEPLVTNGNAIHSGS